MSDSLDWDEIKKAADALGVSYANFHQWKCRGFVPHKWRIPIHRQSKGALSLDMLESSNRAEAAE
jgi:hypothetical protein